VRVLHICKYYPPFAGGMETFVGDLLPALQKKGVLCTALVHAHSRASISAGAVDGAGVEVIRVPTWGRLLYAPVSPSFPLWLEKTLLRTKPDVIHYHMPNTSALWGLVSPLASRIPSVVHWHSDVVASKLDKRLALAYPLYRPFENALLSKAKAIIVTSPPYLEVSQALRPWREKCKVIPLGFDPARLPEPEESQRTWAASQWANAELRILCVGRLTYYKGHETLIRAMAGIKGGKLILVGDGERRARLESVIDSLGLAEKVMMVGYRTEKEVRALLESCEVFCLPSVERTEAFGMVLLEAMWAGKPVVASDVPGSGMGWVVSHGETGLLVVPADPKSLAQALLRLKANDALRKAMGAAARLRFESEFQMSRIADGIIDAYRLVLRTSMCN